MTDECVQLGIEIPDLTSVEWYIRHEDWSSVGIDKVPAPQ